VIGLEIKRDFVDGQLSMWPRRILPGLAAGGGMIAPGLIYVAVNLGKMDRPSLQPRCFALMVALLRFSPPSDLNFER
jgi:Na+/H+ antiporter NhaA